MSHNKSMIKDFIKWNYENAVSGNRISSAALIDEYGVRIRQTRETREYGPDVWEIGSTYFYRSQEGTEQILQAMNTYGLNTVVIRGKMFNDNPWPKNSWATVLIRVL